MADSSLPTIGSVVDEAVKLSTEAWFQEHGGYRSREEAFCADIREITISLRRLPGCRLEGCIGIVGRTRAYDRLDWYRLQKTGSDGYQQVTGCKATV
jgi:hypothetical protein